MWHMCPILIVDTDLIEVYSIMCLSLKATVAKRWTGLGKLVKFVGQTVVDADAVYGMEKRSLEPTLGVFKEPQGLLPDRVSGILPYMCGNKGTILGIKREIKIARTQELWVWHVLHPDAVAAGFVHPSRGMLLCCYFELMVFLHVYSDLS